MKIETKSADLQDKEKAGAIQVINIIPKPLRHNHVNASRLANLIFRTGTLFKFRAFGRACIAVEWYDWLGRKMHKGK